MSLSTITIRSYGSIEELDEGNRELGWPLEYRQLEPGAFSSSFSTLESDSWFLLEEQSSRRVEVEAGAIDGTFVLGMVDGPPAVVNGSLTDSDTIFMQAPGSDLRATLPAGIKAMQVGIPEEALEEVALAVAPDFAIPRRRVALIPTVSGSLARVLRDARACLFASSGREANRNEAVSRILAELVAIAADHGQNSPGRALHSAEARQALSRAREYIEAHLDQSIQVTALCRYAGTTLRTLERTFARDLGISPQQYVKSRRLNAVRRRLLAADREQRALVTEAALAHGFDHLGRFAGEYRRYFGESPRETLAH